MQTSPFSFPLLTPQRSLKKLSEVERPPAFCSPALECEPQLSPTLSNAAIVLGCYGMACNELSLAPLQGCGNTSNFWVIYS
jgi:hypothetical protein